MIVLYFLQAKESGEVDTSATSYNILSIKDLKILLAILSWLSFDIS